MTSLEIERKYLVLSPPAALGDGKDIVQVYFPPSGDIAVRVRITPKGCFLTAKGKREGATRVERGCEIPRDLAEVLLGYCGDRLVAKTRHVVSHGGHEWEVDVFAGRHQGLVMAELELSSESEEFELPPWCGPEVTEDDRYYNEHLAAAPSPP